MAYTDPTESIYRVQAELLPFYSGSINNIYRIENVKLSGTVFYNDQKNTLTKTVGNFGCSYEVFTSFGRTNNNLSNRDYPITQSIARVKLNEQTPFTMPARQTNKNVIATIFSAPGGSDVDANGQRDIEAGEYSSNNSVNLRNSAVRKQVDDDARRVNILPIYTWHKTQRNTQHRISSATLTFETRSDNGFVSHAIPFHIDQQAWLSSSIIKNFNQRRSFLVYFNEQTGSDYMITSSMTGSDLTRSWGSNYYGIYGYPTWVQTRAGENWRHRSIKNRSYYYVNKKENAQICAFSFVKYEK